MKKEPTKGSNKKRIIKRRHYHLIIWSAIAALFVATTSTYAWYTIKKREADSAPADVMKPYYLTLLNPSESDLLQLSVGNLFPGEAKQVVFCVSNKDNETNSAMYMGVSEFDYSIEMIYTENLALTYNIYKLEKADRDTEGAIIASDVIIGTDGNSNTEVITYWKKSSTEALKGTDVSETRHSQLELTAPKPINAGKYISYAKTELIDNKLHLSPKTDGYDAQFFLLEIDWEEGADANFENYKKEVDMIYLLVEALQPKPEKIAE